MVYLLGNRLDASFVVRDFVKPLLKSSQNWEQM